MNKIIKIAIIVAIIGGIFYIGYQIPFWRQKPIPPPPPIEDLKPLPYGSESYIKDGILYTSVRTIPIACITKIELVDDTVRFVIIHYTITKYHTGMIAMSYMEYKRLFGDPDAKT
jgi:hypothetical protein